MTVKPKLSLLDDWRRVARRAWSIRLSVVAAIFTAAEVVVPLFGDVLPRGVFVLLAFSASIGAASILAKVSRDRYMMELDKQYPQYQLAKHKGYPTKLHYELIEQYGIQPFYRRSFLKKQGYWPEGK